MNRDEEDRKRERGGKGRGTMRQGKWQGKGEAVYAPSFPFFSFQQPTRRYENHMPAHSSSLIPPNGGGEFFSRSIDDGAVWYPHAASF